MTVTRHLVFTYGTLKSGEPNHNIMIDPNTGSYELIGTGQTKEKFPLIIASEFNLPFLLNDAGKGHRIFGEIYSVDEQKLVALDELEVHPTFYRREGHPVEMTNGEILKVWIYLLPTWKEELVLTASEPMPNYSSLGSHGRVYVSRYNEEIISRKLGSR
uniref:Gamma-glutamylcyclotransferase family protein n=1 Tax=Acrobeloides nanus TaxID=290746 RepID=A0A914DZ92_9BILA